jgi:hypothetical protein
MPDLSGVGTPITYTEDNPILRQVRAWRSERMSHAHEPENEAERLLLAGWLGFRGREEIREIVGAANYAMCHFDMDMEWRHLIADHIAEECGHGWNFIQLANKLDPTRDYAKDDDFGDRYGFRDRLGHRRLLQRDFLTYLIAGNLWVYGHVTASCRIPLLSSRPVVHYQVTDQLAGEEEHHYVILQKLHDHVWGLIYRYGEAAVKQRIAEIDAEALDNRSRTLWDPPTREFLLNHMGCSLDMAPLFMDWRAYMYDNILGWAAEPVSIREWPDGVPMSMAVPA